MGSEGSHDLEFLRHFSKLRVLQSDTQFSATDIKHLLAGYCVFDSNRVRYQLVKNKKVAIIGVVCSIDEEVIVLSSLTKTKLTISMKLTSRHKLGEVLLLLNPEVLWESGKLKLKINQQEDVISLGESVDFGFCSYEDSKTKCCMEVVNKSFGHMCEKHAKKEFERQSKTIARRQELGGASIYNELRFCYNSQYGVGKAQELSVDRRPGKRRTKPFYNEPDFEKEVDEMPEGREKTHLEALLKRLRPKQIKTAQEQMQEHLRKKQQSSTPISETVNSTDAASSFEVSLMTPQKQINKDVSFVMLESVEPRPTAREIENLIFSLKKTNTADFTIEAKDSQSSLLLTEDQVNE